MFEIGTRFEMHHHLGYRDDSGKCSYHDFDTECEITKVEGQVAYYKVLRTFNEVGKPSWQKAVDTIEQGGFSMPFHKIEDGKLVSIR